MIVGAGTRWTRTDPIALKQTFEGYKVIGIGNSGDELFGLLGLQISGTMHGREGNLIVEEPALLAQPVAISAPDRSVDIFKTQVQGDAVGIYDGGSPDIAGFEGMARWQSFQTPLARLPGRAIFCFGALRQAPSQLSDNGKALIVNVIANHKSQPWVPLSKVAEASEAHRSLERISSSGVSTGQLSAQVSQHRSAFRYQEAGADRSYAHLERPMIAPLALILNGPGQRGYFARKDGASPLSLEFVVTERAARKGQRLVHHCHMFPRPRDRSQSHSR